MKYISVVILIVLLSWTWSLATTERAFSLEDHKRVEAGVEDDIRQFIVRKYPQTTDLYCQEMYTEVVQPKVAMNAHFRCRTEGPAGQDETITQTFEGHLSLTSQDEFKTWTEAGGEIRSSQITFNQGVKISSQPQPGDFPTAEDVAPAVAPVPATHEHK